MSDVIGRMHASEQNIVNKIKFKGKKKEILELSQFEIKLVKKLINKPHLFHLLIDYPDALINGGLFDTANKVCKFYNISFDQLICKRRSRYLVKARIDFIHIVCKDSTNTYEKVGQFLKRDHTNIIHHLNKNKPFNIDKINAA